MLGIYNISVIHKDYHQPIEQMVKDILPCAEIKKIREVYAVHRMNSPIIKMEFLGYKTILQVDKITDEELNLILLCLTEYEVEVK